jgi:hypothetical protein
LAQLGATSFDALTDGIELGLGRNVVGTDRRRLRRAGLHHRAVGLLHDALRAGGDRHGHRLTRLNRLLHRRLYARGGDAARRQDRAMIFSPSGPRKIAWRGCSEARVHCGADSTASPSLTRTGLAPSPGGRRIANCTAGVISTLVRT